MAVLFTVLDIVLTIFWLLLISRIVVEIIRGFARDWRPSGLLAVILEAIFTITDPPVKLVRRLIPPLNIGGIRLDLSIFVLIMVLLLLIGFVQSHALSQSPM